MFYSYRCRARKLEYQKLIIVLYAHKREEGGDKEFGVDWGGGGNGAVKIHAQQRK